MSKPPSGNVFPFKIPARPDGSAAMRRGSEAADAASDASNREIEGVHACAEYLAIGAGHLMDRGFSSSDAYRWFVNAAIFSLLEVDGSRDAAQYIVSLAVAATGKPDAPDPDAA